MGKIVSVRVPDEVKRWMDMLRGRLIGVRKCTEMTGLSG